MTGSALELLLLGAVLVVGMVVQRITGMGSNLVIAPYFVLLMGPLRGVVVVNAIGAITAALCFLQLRAHVQWRVLARLLAGAAMGAPLGLGLIAILPRQHLSLAIGTILLAGVMVGRWLTTARDSTLAQSAPLTVGFGLAAGLLNTVSGTGGLVIGIFAIVTAWEHLHFSATFQPFFVVIGTASAALSWLWGGSDQDSLPLPFWAGAVAALGLGALVGTSAARHVPPVWARRGTVLVSTVGAVTLIATGIH